MQIDRVILVTVEPIDGGLWAVELDGVPQIRELYNSEAEADAASIEMGLRWTAPEAKA